MYCFSHTNISFIAHGVLPTVIVTLFVLSITEGITVKAVWNAIQVKRKLVFGKKKKKEIF
jgi:hypothetical protein